MSQFRTIKTAAARSALLALVALGLLGVAARAVAAPSLRTITLDGLFDDWTEILTNPANATRDDDGSSSQCADSTDRDCPVSPRAADLVRFAWTADDDYWYFYAERVATSSTTQYLFIYFDTDHDGLLEFDEPVVRIELDDESAGASAALLDYRPLAPAGDPLVGLDGHADGWTMPGGAQVASTGNIAPGQGSTPGGNRYEGAIRWNRLRQATNTPMLYHVSLGVGPSLPSDIRDNMGSQAGAGDTGFRGVALEEPLNASGMPGTTVLLPHRAASTGNLPTRLGLRATSSSGLDLTWRRDLDGDGIAETLLGVDALGDGFFAGPGDSLSAAGDSDGDGELDTGVLAGGTEALVEISVPLAPGSRGLKETITVETWSIEKPALRASVTDIVRSGDLTIARDESRFSAPGQVAWIPHLVSETSGRGAVAGFSAFSARGWTWRFWSDPDGDGHPADAVPLTDSNGDGRPDIVLAPLQQATIFASADVPSGALPGLVETATIRVHDGNPVASTVTDRVVVGPVLDLAPNHLVSLGTARYGGAGDTVYFPHRLINASGLFTSFRLAATCDVGWPVTIMTDPDSNGRPDDALPLPTGPVTVPVSGGELPLILRVTVPPTGRVDEVGTITFTAWAWDDSRVTASATDQAVIALIRIYEDPSALYNVSIVDECSTAHAVATGLVPATSHRIIWRDATGTARRMTATTTDASGRCEDSFPLPPDMRGGGQVAEIEGWSGTTWVRLDDAPFAVGDELASVLMLETPRVDLNEGQVAASLLLTNDSFDSDVLGARVMFRLMSPDGTVVLDESGGFVPFTGVEASLRRQVSLAPRASLAVPLSRSALALPVEGVWMLHALREGTCGSDALLGSAPILVLDDVDLDGLSAADEAALGSDPLDADTDDDGVLDGDEGPFDSDGDGIPDVLQCDSDGDGLPDGLEAGIVDPGPDTDLAAGCFRPDADPSTTTDPRLADTDGGGVPDGVEDADRDGARDPGEPDPNDPADDALLDRDGDGLTWLVEQSVGTSDDDADSDDDGLPDGADGIGDSDGDGILDLLDCDSDDDGILDGTEAGITTPGPDTDLASGCFVADADPSTTTDPDVADTDGGGVPDGVEDTNRNGRLDPGETDPSNPSDDWPACSRDLPGELEHLRVRRAGADAVLSWTASADPCVITVVQDSLRLPVFHDVGASGDSEFSDARPLGTGMLRFYRVRAQSWLAGRGP